MATVNISDTFCITWEGDLTAGGTTLIVAPRAFRVVSGTAINVNTAAATVSVLNAGAEMCLDNAAGAAANPSVILSNASTGVGAGTAQSIAINPTGALATVAAGANLEVLAGGAGAANVTKVVLYCVAAAGFAVAPT